jgi:hypothetical protein
MGIFVNIGCPPPQKKSFFNNQNQPNRESEHIRKPSGSLTYVTWSLKKSYFPMVHWQKVTSCISLKSPGINITTGAPVAIKLESVKAQHPLLLGMDFPGI